MSYEPLGTAAVTERDGARVRLRAGAHTVEVTALADGLFRIGRFADGRPPDYASEALAGTAFAPADVAVHERPDAIHIETASGTARIALDPLRVGFADATGRVFLEDDPALGAGRDVADAPGPFGLAAPAAWRLHKRLDGERFHGCGERTRGLEKTGEALTFANYDPPQGHDSHFDNLYSSVPFTLVLRDGHARGLFVDNPSVQRWELGKADAALASFTAASGDVVEYVFCGPAPAGVLEAYTALTGRVALPPLWGLGNQQSRWSYESADELLAVARGFRERGIPCDVVYLDIDYMDGFRVFTWDPERFADPEGLVAALAADGFRVVCITDPGVKADADDIVYREGAERGYFCLAPDGTEYRNAVWPGICAFPDFSNPAVREWWGLHQERALLDKGVAGVWCDMNEPAMFIPEHGTMPDDAVHPGAGRPRRHGEIHNLYGSQMAQAAREGCERARPDRRPFVISRAGYAGLQRHALQWTGDNSSWWEHVAMTVPQLCNLGLSGVAHCGVDVGGFFDDADGELLTRWTELGIFEPFLRNHAVKWARPQEPWAFGEPWESLCRGLLRWRMRLLPYFYGAFEEAARTGAPIMRPLLWEWWEHPDAIAADDQFLCGDALLVAPIVRRGDVHRHAWIPPGAWVQWFSGEVVTGPAHVLAHAPLGQPAVWARANAAIPLWPERMHVADGPTDPLTLRIACVAGAGAATRTMFEDAGEGFGPSCHWFVSCRPVHGGFEIVLGAREGGYDPPRARVQLELLGLGDVRSVAVGGAPVAGWRVDAAGTLVVDLPDDPGTRAVTVVT